MPRRRSSIASCFLRELLQSSTDRTSASSSSWDHRLLGQPWREGGREGDITPILQIGRPQLTGVKWLARSHTVPQRQIWASDLGLVASHHVPSRCPPVPASPLQQSYTSCDLSRFTPSPPPCSFAVSDRLPGMSLGHQSSKLASNGGLHTEPKNSLYPRRLRGGTTVRAHARP